MPVSERHEPRVPFPTLPDAIKARFSIGDLTLRPFGCYESDLDVDFNQPIHPFLITEILECCTRDEQQGKVPQSFLWQLPVGKRIECLLNLIPAGERSEITVTLACENESCAQRIEIDLSMRELLTLQERAYASERVPVKTERRQLELRRPTANDQLTWLNSRFEDEEAVTRAMIRSLVEFAPGDDFVYRERANIEQALDAHDPLIDFKVEAACPYCETEGVFDIDLEELALARLRQAQLLLLASVHSLAKHYHWSEQEIFSVPHWRRAHYLSRISKEGSQ